MNQSTGSLEKRVIGTSDMQPDSYILSRGIWPRTYQLIGSFLCYQIYQSSFSHFCSSSSIMWHLTDYHNDFTGTYYTGMLMKMFL